jgi:hypothetical protein
MALQKKHEMFSLACSVTAILRNTISVAGRNQHAVGRLLPVVAILTELSIE